MRPKIQQKFSSCDKQRDRLNVHGRSLEGETLARQRAVRSLQAQVAQILQLIGMIEIERQKLIALEQKIKSALKI